MKRSISIITILLVVLLSATSCIRKYQRTDTESDPWPVIAKVDSTRPLFYHIAEKDITIQKYFSWANEVVAHYDTLVPYKLTDKVLVHANEWIIDTFAYSDYYHQKELGNFIEDQKNYVVIKKGDTIEIPSLPVVKEIQQHLRAIHIDINLPEYILRLYEGNNLLFAIPVRIGQYRIKFLASEGREFDLRTNIGSGTIVNILEDPRYVNFSTGEAYKYTRRDDGKTTKMPQIPSLEPEINGVCYGQLIHPTTNPNTLGKAYSHGCIGTREGDAWRLYFHVRPGTPIEIRYDLWIIDEKGDSIELEDIYQMMKKI